MTLTPGMRLGPYEVVSPLGAGGMGEVFKARDTRLNRSVAIKILPAEFATDAKLRLRFEREAKAISQLSHPNICALYDVGENYLVMELLEGETLADRIAKGPLPLDQVIHIGSEIANALDRAHKAGIIHRDLKPGNVMLTKSGAKLLDFGLASTKSSVLGPRSSVVETIQKPLTEEGTLLGTFQYMAPEQLEGGEVDARTDIFALGAVLYEMATGRRAFNGHSKAGVIAAILTAQPEPMTAVQPLTPASLEAVIVKALQKDRNDRWQCASDFGWELQRIQQEVIAPSPQTSRGRARTLPWIVAAVAVIVAGIASFLALRSQAPARVTKFTFDMPPGWIVIADLKSGPPAISRDGRAIVFVAVDAVSGRRLLWLRRIDAVAPIPLEGTDDGSRPFWSPDSRSIAFFANNNNKLKRIDSAGGPTQIICETANGRGGTWSANGVIIFAPTPTGSLCRVDARGGQAVSLSKLDDRDHETSHRWPSFLPDGKHYFYVARRNVPGATALTQDRIYVSDIETGGRKLVLEASSNVVYCEPGYIAFVRERTLFAQKFDAGRLQTIGEPVALVSHLAFHASGFGMFDFSPSTLVYQAGVITARLESLDPQTLKSTPLIDVPGEYAMPRLSRDQQLIVYVSVDPASGTDDVWLFDRVRRLSRRLTANPGDDFSAVMSADGTHLFFTSNRTGTPQIYTKSIDGGAEEILLQSRQATFAQSASRDGRYLLFTELGASENDIWSLSLSDGKRSPFCTSPFDEIQPEFSPDGRYVAFASNESGRYEVYVAPFPAGSPHTQISTDGGLQPAWRGDGREIYYISTSGRLIRVPIDTSARVKAGAPVVITTVNLRPSRNSMREYDVAADGKWFLLNSTGTPPRSVPYTVVLNWTEELRNR